MSRVTMQTSGVNISLRKSLSLATKWICSLPPYITQGIFPSLRCFLASFFPTFSRREPLNDTVFISLGIRFWVLGFRYWVLGIRYSVQSTRYWVISLFRYLFSGCKGSNFFFSTKSPLHHGTIAPWHHCTMDLLAKLKQGADGLMAFDAFYDLCKEAGGGKDLHLGAFSFQRNSITHHYFGER